MLKLNPYLNQIEISIIRKFSEEAKKIVGTVDKPIINLAVGEPDLPQPKIIIDETVKYMQSSPLTYPQLGGVLELRKEIAKYHSEKYSVSVSPEEVLVTVGSTEALSTTLNAIVQKGDEVLCGVPIYSGYEPVIKLRGGTLIKIDTEKTGYQLTVELLEENLTDKTRAIVLNYPCNPSGVVLSKKNRDEILEFAKKNNLFLISDEVYSEIVFEKSFNSFLSDEYRENVIVVNSFSKSHSLTGWRIGYLITSKKIRNELLKIHRYTVTSPPIISQYGAIIALKKCQDISENLKIYSERSKVVYDELKKIGLNPIKPEGGIYIFLPLKELGFKDSYDFCLKFLEEEKVVLIPGIAFSMEGFVRISLIQEKTILLEAINRLRRFFKK